MNRIMAIYKKPGLPQQVQYKNIMNGMMIHYLEESRSFPTYHRLKSSMSRVAVKNRPKYLNM